MAVARFGLGPRLAPLPWRCRGARPGAPAAARTVASWTPTGGPREWDVWHYLQWPAQKILGTMADSPVRNQRDRQWPSRLDLHDPLTGGVVIVLIAAAGVYLITNHWLHVLDALPYVWVVLMMGMHLLMHGGHGRGGHGGHRHPTAGPGADTDHVQ